MSTKKEIFPLVGLIVMAFLGCCMELDISIPSFPSIMNHFDATEAQVQTTLSANFFAFCVSGLFYGPLSESLGRRGLMVFGATLFLIGAVGCVFSFSINQLIFWRFVQGLGTSSGIILGFAMISDRYQGSEAAQKISLVNAFCTIFMATAPVIGGVLIHYFTWRTNFSAIAIIGVITWFSLIFFLPETKQEKEPLRIGGIFGDYFKVIGNMHFQLIALLPSLMCVAYLTFVGSAAFYYINTCNINPLMFACHQGLVVASFSITSFYAGKVIGWLGSDRSVAYGMLLCAVSMVMMLVFAYVYPYKPMLITITMSLFAIGCAFPMSVTFAQSLEIIPSLKGVCSSFIMSTRLLITSIAIWFTGKMFDGTMKPVALVMAACVLTGYIILFLLKRVEDTPMQDEDLIQGV